MHQEDREAHELAFEAEREEKSGCNRLRRKLEGPGRKLNAGAEGLVGSMGRVTS